VKQTPLKCGSKPLSRRKPLRSKGKPKLSAGERQETTEFKLAYLGEPCAGCRMRLAQVSHHVIYEQHLRLEDKYRLENAMALCHSCHINHHSANGPKLRREWLAEHHLDFASEVLGEAAGTYLARRYW
jgi:5-methylcytosine-specific restriction endonuclease McrA